MTDKLNDTPRVGNDDDNISTTSSYKRLTNDLRSLESKRRTFRRTLQQYEKIKSRYVDNITKETKDGSAAAPVESKKQVVIASYRLLRNFCISFNTINQAQKENDRQQLPEKYATEIEAILGSKEIVEKFKKALKADNVESSVAELPNEVSEALVKGIIDFINKHDKDEIIAILKKDLETQTTEIDKMRAEQKSKKVANKKVVAETKKKEVKKAPKRINGSSDDKDKTTEQRFRDFIKEVQTKVAQVKLEKDDYQTYSEVQSEVDNFLDEATTEILAIKKGLRKRFENIQTGKKEYQQKSQSKNKPRNKARVPRKVEGEQNNQNSVFSKDQLKQ